MTSASTCTADYSQSKQAPAEDLDLGKAPKNFILNRDRRRASHIIGTVDYDKRYGTRIIT